MPALVFQLIGAGLALAGVMLVAWALFWDRARGRRRCPRCWYDMAGVPGLVCPECGQEAKYDRGLRRTRRRWGAAVAGLILAMSSVIVWSVPVARARGWPAALPNAVLLAALPWMEAPTYQDRTAAAGGTPMPARRRVYDELIEQRLKENRLAPWERRWLIERCIRGDARHRAATEEWRQKYVKVLETMHRAAQFAQQLKLEPEHLAATPNLLLIDMGDRELWRIREGLALASIRTRQRWPVGEPLMFTVDTRVFWPRMPQTRWTVTVKSRLEEALPLTWELTTHSTLIPNLAHEPHGGIARAPQRGVLFHVRVVEMSSSANPKQRTERVLLDTVVRHPVVVSGTPLDILEPIACEATTAALLAELQPVCRWRPSFWQEDQEEAVVLLFGGRNGRALLRPLAATPGLTLGVRIELLRDGQVVADGETYWTALATMTGGPYLMGSSNVSLRLRSEVGTRTAQDDEAAWSVRLTGDPVVALRNFEATHFWVGVVERPVLWQLPRR
jgi:hypothetical protein